MLAHLLARRPGGSSGSNATNVPHLCVKCHFDIHSLVLLAPTSERSREAERTTSKMDLLTSRDGPGLIQDVLDFSNSRSYGSLSSSTSSQAPRLLTPSSSHGSLSSLGSTTSTAEANQVSDKARRELRAYASSFEQVRLQRRRSY